MQETNRFVRFFKKNKNIVPKINYFIKLVGIVTVLVLLINAILLIEKEDSYFSQYKYSPFFLYTHELRETENYCFEKEEPKVTIHTYGGSTMYGIGLKSNETIPSFLSQLLCDNGINANIVNIGQPGYTNTQEVQRFIYHINQDIIPDIVIFYDGANEPLQNKYNIPAFNPIKHKVNEHSTNNNLWKRIYRKIFYFIYKNPPFDKEIIRIFSVDSPLNKEIKFIRGDRKEFYTIISENYIRNTRIVHSLETEFGFKSFIYLQPVLTTKKSLSPEELNYAETKKDIMLDYYNAFYPVVQELIHNSTIISLVDIFDNYTERIYLDDCHKYPHGNKIIAERMSQDIINYLNEIKHFDIYE